jgi:TrmH family RNA methyltransferase
MQERTSDDVRSILARVRRLSRRDVRDQTGFHFVEGVRGVLQVLEAGIPVETLVYSEVLVRGAGAQKRVRLSKRAGIPVLRVTPEQFRSISSAERASGIGAIARQHWTPLESADPRSGLCWIAVSLVRAPGNLGTILRTAEAVGAAGVILLGSSTDPFDPNVVRASMGGIFHLQLVRASLPAFVRWTRRHGCRVIGTSPRAALSYTQIEAAPPVVMLFGEERMGLSAEELALCTDLVSIPIVGRADSLNVSVAAGVLLYDALRRRAK